MMISRRSAVLGLLASGALSGRVGASSGAPIVTTAQGRAQGFVAANGIYTFRGLPYGANTAGVNRFRAPQPPVGWTGIRNATAFGPSAPQSAADITRSAQIAASEDCLVLNVWTPELDRTAKKAVMVWVHGGGFESGSGSNPANDGANLARLGDVVVVTINHRINVFGYTHLGAEYDSEFASSGNAGQLDIVAALHWVRENIAQFGGDASRVTIFGQSGGGLKIAALLAMPAARGLFHRAIIESGPGIRMCKAEEQARATRSLFAKLGIDPRDVRKLQNVPMQQLFDAYAATTLEFRPRGAGFFRVFAPTVDGAALPSDPFDPRAPAVSRDVPLIIGYTHTEATRFIPESVKAMPDLTDAKVAELLRPLTGDSAKALVTAYRAALPSVSPLDIMVLIHTDYPTAAFSRAIASRKAEDGAAPVYMYRFDWETPLNRMRAPHGIDVPFVFSNLEARREVVGIGPEQIRLAHRMGVLWSNFAKTGVPSLPGARTWRPYTTGKRETLLIGNEMQVVADPDRGLRVAVDKSFGFPT